MTREKEIENLLETTIKPEDLVIVSLGKMGRELFELRKKRKEPNDDFYCMGSMGCAIGVALGVAINTPKRVFLLIGDGACLMQLGSFVTLLATRPRNLFTIILNNDSHDSTGGQPTNFSQVRDWLQTFCTIIDVEKGAREDLGRPDIVPAQIVANFYAKVSATTDTQKDTN